MVDGVPVQVMGHDSLQRHNLEFVTLFPAKNLFEQFFPATVQYIRFPCAGPAMHSPAQRLYCKAFRRKFVQDLACDSSAHFRLFGIASVLRNSLTILRFDFATLLY